MQAINKNLSNEQFEILTQKLSEIQDLVSGTYKTSVIGMENRKSLFKEMTIKSNCSPLCAPIVEDKMIPVIENKKQYLFHTLTLEPYQQTGFSSVAKSGEILSGIFSAFKPFELQIQVKNSKGITKDVEIYNITVMGAPQLINYDGSTITQNRGSSLVFNSFQNYQFHTFGCSAGQGVWFGFNNPYNEQLTLLITIVGSESNINNIGRDAEYSRYLFNHGICKKNETTKIEVLAARKGNCKVKKLQIHTLDFDGKKSNINILDITHKKSSKFANSENIKIPSSFFEDSKEINLGEFGACSNQGLIFEFENPTDKDVRIYISLEIDT